MHRCCVVNHGQAARPCKGTLLTKALTGQITLNFSKTLGVRRNMEASAWCAVLPPKNKRSTLHGTAAAGRATELQPPMQIKAHSMSCFTTEAAPQPLSDFGVSRRPKIDYLIGLRLPKFKL